MNPAENRVEIGAAVVDDQHERQTLQQIHHVQAQDNSTILAGAFHGDIHVHQKPDNTQIVRQAIFRGVQAADLCRQAVWDRKGTRTPGTCEWILEVDEYKAWLADEASSRMLWISGGAGKGKTILSAFLTEDLERRSRSGEHSPAQVIYHFCDYREDCTVNAILRSLVAQMFRPEKTKRLIEHAVACFEHAQAAEDVNLTDQALWRIFESMMRDPGAGRVYCVLDGLDECQEEVQARLIDKFDAFFSRCGVPPPGSSGTGLRLAIVGQVLGKLDKMATQPVRLKLEDHAVRQQMDIRRYVSSWVERAANGMQRVDKKWLQDALVDGANGSFLWARLVLGELDHVIRPSREEVEQTLGSFPRGLERCYSRVLRRVCRTDADTVKAARILHSVALATRPLTVAELAVAMGAYQGGGGRNAIEEGLYCLIERLEPLLSICQPYKAGALNKGKVLGSTARGFELARPGGEDLDGEGVNTAELLDEPRDIERVDSEDLSAEKLDAPRQGIVMFTHASARSYLLGLGEQSGAHHDLAGEDRILLKLAIKREGGHLELARRCVQLPETMVTA